MSRRGGARRLPDASDLSISALVYLFAERLLPPARWSYWGSRVRLPAGVLVDHAALSGLLLPVGIIGLRERGLVVLQGSPKGAPAVLVRLTAPFELPRRWRRGRRIAGRVYPADTVEGLLEESLASRLAYMFDRGQIPPESAPAIADGFYRPPPEVTISWCAMLKGIVSVDTTCTWETGREGLTHRLGGWAIEFRDRGEFEARFRAWLQRWEQLDRTEGALLAQLRDIAITQARSALADLNA